ncbi:unnamed protein product, partial [Laminaria digitata]
TRDQLHLWGVQPPPGLARQYATTRHVEGAGGMNVMTMSDFIDSDSALSHMLRSVAPPGAGGGASAPPLVRVVRDGGVDGRWTQTQRLVAHDMQAVVPGPSPNTTRLFPDGPSAATQAQTTPVVHPLLMRQTRTPGSGGGRSGGRGRSSRGAGNFAPSARQQAALGLLPNERLIWDSHMGALGGPGGVPDQTLMDAIE